MNSTHISISVSLVLTLLLFYYIISTYQATVPGASTWLIKGKMEKERARLAALANGGAV
jgi:hypothetical protein